MIPSSRSGSLADSLSAATAAVGAGARILVTASEALNTSVTVSTANIEIQLKPGVVISKGSAATGIIVNAAGFVFRGGTLSGFSGGSDKAFDVQSGGTK